MLGADSNPARGGSRATPCGCTWTAQAPPPLIRPASPDLILPSAASAFDTRRMSTKTIAPPRPAPGNLPATRHPAPASDLAYLQDRNLFRCAVPTRHGGLGGEAHELAQRMAEVCEHSMSAALLFWGQRLAIEFVLQSANVALRDYLLHDLLSGDRA
ncbi:MAG: acyl-CoA dehydrogenase, partial [Curvibacter sp.]